MNQEKTQAVCYNLRSRNRRNGFVTIYLALSLIALIGISSLVVDLGIAYQKRAVMQKAADASALDGAAYAVQNPTALADAIKNEAANFASTNYQFSTINDSQVSVVVTPIVTSPGNGQVTVFIGRPQPTLFARIFRIGFFSGNTSLKIDAMQIGARARATFNTKGVAVGGVTDNVNSYGLNSKLTANLSLVGPLGTTNRGDNRSSYYTSNNGFNDSPKNADGKWLKINGDYAKLDDGGTDHRPEDDRLLAANKPTTPVTEPIPTGDGYYFDLKIPSNTPVALQLYDPGNYNEDQDPTTTPAKKWNETSEPGNSTRAWGGSMRSVVTKTLFQVWCDMGDPSHIKNAKRVFSKVYSDEKQFSFNDPSNAAYGGWVNAVSIDPLAVDGNGVRLYPDGAKFYMNVTTIDGSGKNGFNVRLNRLDAKTKLPKDTNTDYEAVGGNGTNVTTRGYLPISFGANGTADLSLGYVPKNATSVTIDRFDVDVGTDINGFAVNYKTTPLDVNGNPDPNPANSKTKTGDFGYGGINANDITQSNTINLIDLYPGGYPGGNWSLSYKAGQSDQSTWHMSYVGPGATTDIRLVD